MAKKNLAEAAAAILSGNMASLAPMSRVSEPFGSVGTNPTQVMPPGEDGMPETVVDDDGSVEAAGVAQAVAATPTATPPGTKSPVPSNMKSSPQMNEEDEEEEDDKDMKHMKEEDEDEKEEKKSHMKEDLDALFNGEDLSEDFRRKAATIFEAAVTARVAQIEEDLQDQYANSLEMVSEQLKEEMTDKVDDYLNYVVEEWVKENELAIETGLRSELTEDFMMGLRNLFIEHYIDIPEEKVDVVEEMTAQVVELENNLNEQIEHSVELKKQLNQYKRLETVYAVCEGLTATQVEKLKALSEGVEFVNEEDFLESLVTLRENYFTKKVTSKANEKLDEETDIVEQQSLSEETKKKTNADPIMDAYVKSISRTIIK